MRAPTPIAELKFVGGAMALDFVNTVGSWREGDFRDALVSPYDVIAWAKRAELIDAACARALAASAASDPAAAQKLLRDARKLRHTLHAIFDAIASDQTPSRDDAELLGAAVERAVAHRRLTMRAEGFVWSWSNGDALATILDRLAFAAATLLVDPTRKPVKACPAHACGWLFLDTSRNGKRRWCSEEDCGTPSRVRAFRERKTR